MMRFNYSIHIFRNYHKTSYPRLFLFQIAIRYVCNNPFQNKENQMLIKIENSRLCQNSEQISTRLIKIGLLTKFKGRRNNPIEKIPPLLSYQYIKFKILSRIILPHTDANDKVLLIKFHKPVISVSYLIYQAMTLVT